jgi:hypothetical protein
MSRQALERNGAEFVNFRRGVSGWVACHGHSLQAVAGSSVFGSSVFFPVLGPE